NGPSSRRTNHTANPPSPASNAASFFFRSSLPRGTSRSSHRDTPARRANSACETAAVAGSNGMLYPASCAPSREKRASTWALKARWSGMLFGGKSSGRPPSGEECLLCRYKAISKESPTKVPSCCVEEVVGSYRMGSVKKSVPSANLRLAGTPSFLRVSATSTRGIQVVE
ncbi:MAG: hypothetical protein Q9200_000407, partial [Gallowayella weberi]